jgi:hypothetical protein
LVLLFQDRGLVRGPEVAPYKKWDSEAALKVHPGPLLADSSAVVIPPWIRSLGGVTGISQEGPNADVEVRLVYTPVPLAQDLRAAWISVLNSRYPGGMTAYCGANHVFERGTCDWLRGPDTPWDENITLKMKRFDDGWRLVG